MTDDNAGAREERAPYEPPVIEDLDSGQGPVATAPGTVPQSFDTVVGTSAPRDV